MAAGRRLRAIVLTMADNTNTLSPAFAQAVASIVQGAISAAQGGQRPTQQPQQAANSGSGDRDALATHDRQVGIIMLHVYKARYMYADLWCDVMCGMLRCMQQRLCEFN